MTLRHMFIRPVFDRDSGGDGGNPPANRQPNENDPPRNREEDDFENFWNDEPKRNDPDDDDEPEPRRSQQNPPTNNDDQIEAFFNERVPEISMSDEMREAYENNDMQAYAKASNSAIRQQMRRVYQNMFVDMQKFVQTRIDKAIEDAVSKATTNVGADQAVNRMFDELRYTRDPAIAPVAKHVLARAMRKTKDVPQAIKMVDKYFEYQSNQRTGRKSASGYNRGRNVHDDGNSSHQESNEDFMELFGVPEN